MTGNAATLFLVLHGNYFGEILRTQSRIMIRVKGYKDVRVF